MSASPNSLLKEVGDLFAELGAAYAEFYSGDGPERLYRLLNAEARLRDLSPRFESWRAAVGGGTPK